MFRPELMLFAHVAARPESELDLAQAALLIAEEEYPNLDVAAYVARLDEYGEALRQRLADLGAVHDEKAAERLKSVLDYLYKELGFHGAEVDYYDPCNSWLSDVLDRRRGIPISLAIILVEVLERAGIEAAGVSFPGHFLVRSPGPRGPLFIDPSSGTILDQEGLRQLYGRVAGEPSDPDPRLLEPADKRQIVVRMLHNLRGIFAARGDRPRLRSTLERLEVMTPSEELRREILALGGHEEAPPPPKSRVLN